MSYYEVDILHTRNLGPLPVAGQPRDIRVNNDYEVKLFHTDQTFKYATKAGQARYQDMPLQWQFGAKNEIEVFASAEFEVEAHRNARRRAKIRLDHTPEIEARLRSNMMKNLECLYEHKDVYASGHRYHPSGMYTGPENRLKKRRMMFYRYIFGVDKIEFNKQHVDNPKMEALQFDYRSSNIVYKGSRDEIACSERREKIMFHYDHANEVGIVYVNKELFKVYMLEDYPSIEGLIEKANSEMRRMFSAALSVEAFKNELQQDVYGTDGKGKLVVAFDFHR